MFSPYILAELKADTETILKCWNKKRVKKKKKKRTIAKIKSQAERKKNDKTLGKTNSEI